MAEEQIIEPTEPTEPIEPVEPIETTEPVEPTEPTEPVEPVEPVTPPKQSAQERINEITRKYRDAERETDYWKNLAIEKKEEPVAQPETGRPRQEAYETVEEYEDAYFDWRISEQESATSQVAQQKQIKENISKFNKNAADLRKEHEDFDNVIETPVFTDSMRKVLFEIDNGPMVAYHIAKNSEIADKIHDLSPERQIYEIGKLETQLLLAQKTKSATTAPEPITPVGATGAPEIDPSKLSTADWMEHEKNRELEKLEIKLKGG